MLSGPLSETATPTGNVEVKSGFQTSEFSATVLAILGPIVALLAIVYKIPADQTAEVNTQIALVVGAVGTALSGVLALWRFVHSRTAIKTASIQANASTTQNRESANANVQATLAAAATLGSLSQAQKSALQENVFNNAIRTPVDPPQSGSYRAPPVG